MNQRSLFVPSAAPGEAIQGSAQSRKLTPCLTAAGEAAAGSSPSIRDEEGYPPFSRFRLELVREPKVSYDPGPVDLSRPGRVVRFLWEAVLEREAREILGALHLDSRHRLIGYQVAYRGTLERVAAEPRRILAAALLANAAGVVAFHNHPSGDSAPSREDLQFTRRLDRASKALGVHLIDHLVIGGPDAWCSLRERGGW